MAEQIGTYHLAANMDLYEVQRKNNFEFIISFADGTHNEDLLRAGVLENEATASDYINVDRAQEIVRLSVVTSSVPHFSQNTIEIKRGNSTMKLAGAPTFSAGSFEVNDYIGADTKSVLMAWQALSYNVRTEKVGKAKDYKRNCTLVELTPDNEVVRYWELSGCWISELSESGKSVDDDGKQTITATIQYDRAIPHLPDVL